MSFTHAITIRTINRLLIVSANDDLNPIQLVQQLDSTNLCVHLKNGVTYNQSFDTDKLDETIMEMFGYRRHKFEVCASLWGEGDDDRVQIRADGYIRHRLCRILQGLFVYNSYIAELVTKFKLISKTPKGDVDCLVWHGEMFMRDELLGEVCTAICDDLEATDFCSAKYPRMSSASVRYFVKPLNVK